MIKISIIIPVYNASKFLKKCLDSVENQTFKDYEVILINDGSKDNSLEIIRSFQKNNFGKVNVVNKKNTGVSDCRNIGIIKAKGDFIMFVDADDFLDKDALKNYYEIITKEDSDLLIGTWNEISENKKQLKQSTPADNFNSNVEDKLGVVLNHYLKNRTGGAPWAKLFRKSIILQNNIKFPIDLPLGEDYIFLLQVIVNIKTVSFYNKPDYYYRVDGTGAAIKYRADYFKIQLKIEKSKETIIEKSVKDPSLYIETRAIYFVKCCYDSCINLFKCRNANRYSNIKEICNNDYTKKMVSCVNNTNLSCCMKILKYFIQRKKYLSIYIYSLIINLLQNLKRLIVSRY